MQYSIIPFLVVLISISLSVHAHAHTHSHAHVCVISYRLVIRRNSNAPMTTMASARTIPSPIEAPLLSPAV